MPSGVTTPDWARMFAVTIDDNFGTALRVLDPRTGALLDRVHVDAGMSLADGPGFSGRSGGLSPSGRRLVLTGGPTDGNGRRSTTLLRLYDTAALHTAPHAVSLPGELTVTGIDDGGRNLYLTQYTMQSDGSAVVSLRRYDLVHDTLDANPVVPRGHGGQSATSDALDSIATQDGAWLLSLYVFDSSGPWVQALDLATGSALRIDLPNARPSSSSAGELDLLWSLSRSHDGRQIYAVNAALGTVVDITAAPPFAARTGTLPTPSPSPSPAAWSPFGVTSADAKRLLLGGSLISPDDRTLYAAGDNGVAVIDTRALTLRRTLLADQPPESLALSADGRWLYVVSAAPSGGLYQVDTTTGAVVSIPQYSDVSGVLRVAAVQ